jgi:hypothetical protein
LGRGGLPQRVTVGARDGLSLLMPTFEERQLPHS